MATIQIGEGLNEDEKLWRYIPLEILIHLLDSRTLYFTPLADYHRSDPFEGYLPKVGMDAFASVSRIHQQRMHADIDHLERYLGPNLGRQQIAKLRKDVSQFHKETGDMVKKIASCVVVNCWHRNQHESEGMWGLYSRSGVAIRTSVKSMKHALQGNDQSHLIYIGAVKYLDFADELLKTSDCLTADGHMIGMIKRVAYAHENEVRMLITGDIDPKNPAAATPKPKLVKIDIDTLIEGLVISPFASVPMRNSIRAVAAKYGIDASKVTDSPLLENCEYLFESY